MDHRSWMERHAANDALAQKKYQNSRNTRYLVIRASRMCPASRPIQQFCMRRCGDGLMIYDFGASNRPDKCIYFIFILRINWVVVNSVLRIIFYGHATPYQNRILARFDALSDKYTFHWYDRRLNRVFAQLDIRFTRSPESIPFDAKTHTHTKLCANCETYAKSELRNLELFIFVAADIDPFVFFFCVDCGWALETYWLRTIYSASSRGVSSNFYIFSESSCTITELCRRRDELLSQSFYHLNILGGDYKHAMAIFVTSN